MVQTVVLILAVVFVAVVVLPRTVTMIDTITIMTLEVQIGALHILS